MRKNILFPGSIYACFLIGFISLTPIAKANPVDSLTAKNVAANFYARNYRVKVLSLSLGYIERSSQGEPEYYVYNIMPDNGFVIVAADDAACPILGYSSEGYYKSTNITPGFTFWMKHYTKQIDFIRAHNSQASDDIKSQWEAYKNNLSAKSPKKIAGNVSPLVSTVWAQAPYFNALCPGGSVAGCIATAMAQIMKYWAYPPHGVSSNSYTDSPYGVLTANFDTTQYDWAEMPDNVTHSNYPVAVLSYDCGISVDMSYSPSSSGSYMVTGDDPVCAQSAFVQYFGYESSIQGLYRSNYTDANWIPMLENELNNGRPFMYAGSGDSGAHAWVCDGYNSSGDFHMNWGWAGYDDGYYNINALNPDDIPLNEDQQALIGIHPAPPVVDFSANPPIIHPGDTINFTDNSFSLVPITGWQWSFPGGVTANSNIRNPVVKYNSAGIYNVSETVTSKEGSNILTQDNYVAVLPNNILNVFPTLSDGTFYVQSQEGSSAGNLQFSLYNMLGQKMYTTTLVQPLTQLTVVVPHGMYFFRAFDASGKPVSTGKLAIK